MNYCLVYIIIYIYIREKNDNVLIYSFSLITMYCSYFKNHYQGWFQVYKHTQLDFEVSADAVVDHFQVITLK